MSMADDEEEDDDLLVRAHSLVPSLESLALKALAHAVHEHEPTQLSILPYGGGAALVRQLAASKEFAAFELLWRIPTVRCRR